MSASEQTAQALPARAPASKTLKQLLHVPLTMAVFALVVASLANSFWLSAATSTVALSLSVAGLAILYGQLGLVSLCQFALVGVGGWVTLRIGHAFHPPFEVSMLAGGIVASFVGLVFGIPALRLRGLYLALVTLMLAGAFQIVISAWGFPDGGPGFLGRADGSGRAMLPRPDLADGAVAYFLYVCAVTGIGLLVAQWHKLSRPGRAWTLIRKGETVAVASGVDVLTYKAWAFALSGFLAGIAGALLAGNVGQLDGRAFGAFESLNLFALAIVGGVFNWYGALIAGLLLRAIPALLTDLGMDGYMTIGIFGVALFHALATAPSGIAGQIAALASRLRRAAGREQ
ncbi:branched-chain amino acid ABC transporter permease [Pseudaminobacter soli (ex Li et al. 2025)]|uniref:Branched-chain amino acid ABC transporter permease n=1 Tax=Pseudaminobacter soli (ex Li et al. 2025) TaxID=1295366 RepID=A0A2P7S1W4_9HYPH|nr:branched-chain amino acid ABC transporter permease [Mesorhizobium soli]PSJ56464.1 branched-chain amino acid ABC transporter permease [Mesorhizobium soli]